MLRHYHARFETSPPGVTLLEITIVTVIIGTIAALAALNLQGIRERAQAAAADIRIIEAEPAVYTFENRAPPVSLAVIGRASALRPLHRKSSWASALAAPATRTAAPPTANHTKPLNIIVHSIT